MREGIDLALASPWCDNVYMARYECDPDCDACCRQFIVEADELDLEREPRLASVDHHHRDLSIREIMKALRDQGKVILVTACKPCQFLTDDRRCSIYATRPNACVALQPGDEQCQQARETEGLPALIQIAD